MLPTRGTASLVAVTCLSLSLSALPAQALTTPSGTHARAAAGAAARAPRTAESVLAELTLRQRVGQLFMVGTPATKAADATKAAISRRHVGNVMLTGRSYGGPAAPARVAKALQRLTTAEATDDVGLLVATDQEGGYVQVLNGPGFSDMPTALQQGHWRLARLRKQAGTWASQLTSAGVNMNLAPVEDTVPSARAARHNPPIGAYDREFGYRVKVVAGHGRAFVLGMADKGVVPTIKHFPGLGRVHANTDTTGGVTDRVTTRHDAYLKPFATSIDAGVPVVMMSTAYYQRLDPDNPAAFSKRIIGRMLRGDLGFDGVVVSDDLANARQVAPWTPAARAIKFLVAGGDLVLTVDPTKLPAMYAGVLARAKAHKPFRKLIAAAALRVLRLKEDQGLL